jgi:hypothetical protein
MPRSICDTHPTLVVSTMKMGMPWQVTKLLEHEYVSQSIPLGPGSIEGGGGERT